MNQRLKPKVVAEVEDLAVEPGLELVLAATTDNLAAIRTLVSAFVRGQLPAHGDAFPLDEVLLAVQEACTNVVRHAYRGEAVPGRLFVRADITPYMVCFRIADEGPGFDPSKIPPPDFNRPADGGYGLHLIRKTMSMVNYRRTEGYNELVLSKIIPGDRELEYPL